MSEELMNDRVVIVSGFGAFRDYRHDEENPSTPLVRQFAYEVMIRDIRCEIVAPVAVNWGEIESVLATQVERHRDLRITWIAFGAGRDFAIETSATNRRATDVSDVSGRWAGKDVSLLNDEGADPDAAEGIPLSAESLLVMQQALAARGFAVRLSGDAGGYICNSAAYAIYKAQREGAVEAAMFLHTPEALSVEHSSDFAAALANVLFVERATLA